MLRFIQRRSGALLLILAAMCVLAACSQTSSRPAASAASNLPAHPRLIARTADWQALAERRRSEPQLNAYVELLISRARDDLRLKPLERKLTGRRLLSVSREFIRRTLQWSFAYRLTGEAAFLDRARSEMLNVASFGDWNPSHYLDVAEMSTGMAIGYDWLYHDLNEADRRRLRQAIVSKGIAQARHGHSTFSRENNWGQVCIGGMVLGALAIEEDEPALARDLLTAARKSAFIALTPYQPDGIYPEGPSYWNYGSSYEVLLIAALRSAKGEDWGLMAAPGFLRSAEFYAQSVGPSGKSFNFADGGEGQELSSALFYLARELGQPAFLEAKLQMIRDKKGLNERFAPLIALWWPSAENAAEPALAFHGQGAQPLAIWRSSWTDPNALYLAIKAGGAAHNHAHMDAGSFVLDMDGLRWAKDLGMQNYESLESRGVDLWNMKQSSPRWQVFRLNNDSHNTLSINGSRHNANGMATLSMASAKEALIDLTPALLPGQVKQATRRASFASDGVELKDTITGAKAGSSIRWAMNTEAAISLQGNEATLSQNGKTLHVRFSAAALKLEVRDIARPPNEADAANPNTRQLIATAPADGEGNWQLTVRFSRH